MTVWSLRARPAIARRVPAMVNLRAEHDNGSAGDRREVQTEATAAERSRPVSRGPSRPSGCCEMPEGSARGGCYERTEGIVVARMSDEERERRASLRARLTAEAAEADDRRMEERRLQWPREGVYMNRAKIEAGEQWTVRTPASSSECTARCRLRRSLDA